MKKILIALTLCIAIVASMVLLTACSSETIDISGDYKTATQEQLNAKLQNVDMVVRGNYQVKMIMTMQQFSIEGEQVQKMESTVDGVYSYQDDKVTMSGTVKTEGLEENSANGSVYMDGSYAYIDNGEKKYKLPADTTGLTQYLPSGDISDNMLGDLSNVEIGIAESGNTIKIKVQDLSNKDNIMYIVVKDGAFDGIVMKISIMEGMTVDLRMKHTNKTPTVPSDLDSYKSPV